MQRTTDRRGSSLSMKFHRPSAATRHPHPHRYARRCAPHRQPSLVFFSLDVRRAALLAVMVISTAGTASGQYTERMYRRAMSKDNLAISGSMSLAPLYVLITLRSADGLSNRKFAVESNFLSGAIHREHNLGYDARGERKAFQIALSQPERVFQFSNKRARNNVEPRYTPQILADVRRRLAGRSRSELLRQVRADNSYLHQIYRSQRSGLRSWAYMDAVAQVLLEHGILVGSTHWGPFLYVDDPSQRSSS